MIWIGKRRGGDRMCRGEEGEGERMREETNSKR
jgi:hypothetical protein